MLRPRAFVLPVLLGLAMQVWALGDDPKASIEEAKRLADGGAELDALMLLQDAVSRFPDDGVLRHELAIAYHSLDRFREALDAYGKACELAPDNPDFRLAYGGALYQSGEVEAGRDQLLRVVTHPDSPADAYVVLAAVHEKLGERESAYQALERYLELQPEDEETRIVYAEQLVAAKQNDEALRVLKAGLSVETGDGSAEFYHRIAEAASRGSAHAGDLERFALLAIEKDPDYLAPRLLLARRLSADDADKAVALLEPALDEHAEVPELHFALSTAYRRLGQADKALKFVGWQN